MDPISTEDLALLEVLQRIDQGTPLASADSEIRQRLIADALVAEEAGMLRLTAAGVELCKSLQHRKAADDQAARLRQGREGDGASAGNGADAPTPAA